MKNKLIFDGPITKNLKPGDTFDVNIFAPCKGNRNEEYIRCTLMHVMYLGENKFSTGLTFSNCHMGMGDEDTISFRYSSGRLQIYDTSGLLENVKFYNINVDC